MSIPGNISAFYVDSLVHDERVPIFLIETLGEDAIALGTDYPFLLGELEPDALIESSSISEKTKRKLLCENALAWLDRKVAAGKSG